MTSQTSHISHTLQDPLDPLDPLNNLHEHDIDSPFITNIILNEPQLHITEEQLKLITFNKRYCLSKGMILKGVEYNHETGKWKGFITINGNMTMELGEFDHIMEAAMAHDRKILKLNRRKEQLNLLFPYFLRKPPSSDMKYIKSKYWGVTFNTKGMYWQTCKMHLGHKINLSHYETEEDAARAFNEKCIEYGDKRLNLVTDTKTYFPPQIREEDYIRVKYADTKRGKRRRGEL